MVLLSPENYRNPDSGAGAAGRLGDAGHAAVPEGQRERVVRQPALPLGEVRANEREAGGEYRIQVRADEFR
jgi:hypothetical protein